MSSTRTLRWVSGEQVWLVAARYLAESGYETISAFVDALRAANPSVVDWTSVEPGTLVSVPYLTT